MPTLTRRSGNSSLKRTSLLEPPDCRRDLFLGRHLVVPRHLVLHERHTTAFQRPGDETARTAGLVGNAPVGLEQRRVVVAVDLPHVPAESPPLVRQRLEP